MWEGDVVGDGGSRLKHHHRHHHHVYIYPERERDKAQEKSINWTGMSDQTRPYRPFGPCAIIGQNNVTIDDVCVVFICPNVNCPDVARYDCEGEQWPFVHIYAKLFIYFQPIHAMEWGELLVLLLLVSWTFHIIETWPLPVHTPFTTYRQFVRPHPDSFTSDDATMAARFAFKLARAS